MSVESVKYLMSEICIPYQAIYMLLAGIYLLRNSNFGYKHWPAFIINLKDYVDNNEQTQTLDAA